MPIRMAMPVETTTPSLSVTGGRLRYHVMLALAFGLPLLIFICPAWLNWLFPLMIGVHALGVIAAFIPNCQWFGPVMTRFRTRHREVWLTIDDGPHSQDTPRVLALLKRYQARATFFVVGTQVEALPHLAQTMAAHGHELANHSHTHPINWFWCAPPWMVARQIDRGNRAIEQTIGRSPRWFRSPLGANNCFVHAALRPGKQFLLGWTARGFDGVHHDPTKIVDRIMRNLRPGAIVLLHEGKRDAQGNSTNVLVLEKLLQKLTEQGYACVVPATDQII